MKMAADTGRSASPGTYGGLGVVTLTTLMYEIGLTRIFSVTMWYHFAFMSISIALLGMTAGALIVYLRPHHFPDELLSRRLWQLSLTYAVSIALCFTTMMVVPFVPRWTVAGVYSVIINCLLIAVPFTLSGIIVCLVLTRFPSRVNRLYAVDLIGAALGAVLIVRLFALFDGPSAIIAIGALAAIATIAFASASDSTRGLLLGAIAFLGLGGFAVLNTNMADRGNAMLAILWAKEGREPKYEYETWNAFSRVTVQGPALPGTPFGWGMSETLPKDYAVSQLWLTIDGVAGTPLTAYGGDPRETDFLRYDITNLPHYARPGSDVLVVGVGGGRDILSALEFEQPSVTGVELNSNILKTVNKTYGDFTGHLDRDPRVHFVSDEARSYLTRSHNRYGIIQISLIDTWAATSAGAFALSENSLYTVDAWDTFLDRLQPDGVLSVTRYFQFGLREPFESYRLVALAMETLKRRGVTDPRAHILMYMNGQPNVLRATMATIMISPEPFSPASLAAVSGAASALKFRPVLTPTEAYDETFAELATVGRTGAVVRSFDEDISAPTDDRPFFFQMGTLKGFFTGSLFSSDPALQPVLVLGVLAVVVVALTALLIGAPLTLWTERSTHAGMAPFYVYFAAIGLGFLLVEVAQLQRFSIFLGHPTYAITVVLFSLLLFSGLGSMLSEVVARIDRPISLVVILGVVFATILACGIATPELIDTAADKTTTGRIMTAVALLAPMGLVMGMAFPLGMRMASERPLAPMPFLWGINGATSVCASVLGMGLALFFGVSLAFWAGTACYGVALAAMAYLVLRAAPASSLVQQALAEPIALSDT